ncbi:MAG TPA: carboxypeptidase regulatory-like domain-containing protein [Acidobacteriaceae bacterium]|nr:carboxypeptidase regulatory-like domain-containing protein [Acidobacteriaceae bacterium]
MTLVRTSAVLKALSLLFVSTVFAATALGQATTGSISGHVVDASGRVVQGASISVQNVDKGLVATASTDNSGDFTLPAMPPDHYRIVIEKSGFASASVPPFKLDIDQRANFNIPLKVGEVSTSVTVSDEAPVLQTQGAETGEVIGSREIADLPTLGRNFSTLLFLVPGVVSGTKGANTNLDVSINGQREYSNSYQINGVEVSGLNNDTNVRPSPDAIQEFKVVTSTYAPEFGRASGGAILIQTKSGTNNIHGSAFFFYRPTATAANNNFAPAGTSPTTVQKNYGATIGGPIIKDKAFLFLGYEGFRNTFSSSYLGETLVGQNEVTFDAAGDADLSKLLDPYTGTQVPIFNPYFFQSNYYTQQFPGNIIPANLVDPGGKSIVQKLFPAPRGPQAGNPYANFQTTEMYNLTSNVGNLRADYTFSQNHRLYVTYDVEQGTYNTTDPYAGAIPLAGGGGADTGGLESYENNVFAISDDYTFSPHLLNEARATYFISPVTEKSLVDGTNLATQFGIKNANIPGFPQTYGFPQIQVGTGAVTGGSTFKPFDARENVLGLIDSVSYTRSAHTAKIGYEYRKLKSLSSYSLFPVPYEYFAGPGSNFTSDPYYGFYNPSAFYYNGGSEIADILLGLPEVVYQGLQYQVPQTSANEHTVYIQDYWQIKPRINLTYGLRYEYLQPFVEQNNNQSNFDVNTLTINIAGRGNNSRSLVNSNTTDIMPRVGIAFQLRPKTVLRGGFGVFYTHENDGKNVVLTQNYPFYTEQQITSGQYGITYNLSTGVARPTTNPVPSTTASLNLTTVPGAATQVVQSEPANFPTAYTNGYNVTMEQQLGNSTSLEIGYVGATSRDLSQKVGNYNVNNHLSSKLGNVNLTQASGIGNYDSLQAKINRPITHGYGAILSYTWSHNRDNGPAPPDLGLGGDYPQNPFNVNAEYANADYDVRNNFTAAQLIELPFGRGRHFLSNTNHVTDILVGGWQLNSITTLRGGVPINIVSNSGNPLYPGLRPNLVGNPSVGHRSKSQWFNPKAFAVPAGQAASAKPGATVPLVTGNAGRNFIYGPGYTNEDISLFKVLSLPRELKLQIRIEAFNVLNTARYGQPNGNFTSGSFGQITGGGTGNQRIMQFGGRFVF